MSNLFIPKPLPTLKLSHQYGSTLIGKFCENICGRLSKLFEDLNLNLSLNWYNMYLNPLDIILRFSS